MRAQKIPTEQYQRHRHEASQREAKRLQELECQQRASYNQPKPDRRRTPRESLLELVLIGRCVSSLCNQLGGSIGIYDRVNVERKPSGNEGAPEGPYMPQLKKARDRQKMNEGFDVLTIVDGSQSGQEDSK